jgi:hypothetical protein
LNIKGTLYENVDFNRIEKGRNENDWVHCKKENGTIICAGGPHNLEEMVLIIKQWMDDNKPIN